MLGATGSQPLEVLVKTRRGNHWARIYYAFADPGRRIGSATTVPSRSETRRSNKRSAGPSVACPRRKWSGRSVAA